MADKTTRIRFLMGTVFRGGNVDPGFVVDVTKDERNKLGAYFAEDVPADTPLKGTIAPLVPPPPPEDRIRVVVLRATVIEGKDVFPPAELEVPVSQLQSLLTYGSVRRVDAGA